MEELVRERRPLRILFGKYEAKAVALLATEPVDVTALKVTFSMAVETFEKLAVVDQKFIEFMRANAVGPEAEDKEYEGQGEYKMMLEFLREKVDKFIHPQRAASYHSDPSTEMAQNGGHQHPIRNYTLPQVQIPKFDGQLKNWLGYWAKFESIHEDKFMSGTDKFTYLLQTLETNSEPFKIVSRFPQNSANYILAVEALKRKFANPDLLLEVYIRELLGLVISNVTAKDKLPLKEMFLALDSQIRSLRTLNLEQADPSVWLFPLVEACLPSNVLKVWKRRQTGGNEDADGQEKKNRIDLILEFMEKEVDLDDDVHRAEKFSSVTCSKSPAPQGVKRKTPFSSNPLIPTMAGFHVGDEGKEPCVFCGKDNHKSWKCFSAKRMDISVKKEILKKNSRCFKCLGHHHSWKCKSNIRCQFCNGIHVHVMCEKRGQKQIDEATPKRPRLEETNITKTMTSSNHVYNSNVVLQTIQVKVGFGENQRTVRVFLDPGSQRSYILKSTVRDLKIQPISVERVVHSLFGGKVSKPTLHQIYEVDLVSLNGQFSRKIRLRDQSEICGKIPSVLKSYPALELELKKCNLELSDNCTEAAPIEILIGADIYTKITTGRRMDLECGLTAIETNFGWTLLGELEETTNITAVYQAMMVSDATITQLWDLEKLGIENPEERRSTEEMQKIMKGKFVANITRTPEGRFKVKLPWKDGHPVLPSNKQVALKRLENTVEKLKKNGLLEEYGNLFDDWEKEGFIEKVANSTTPGHYVPHRPVIKRESTTTPVRPVFDASCKTSRNVSLNDCLEKGPNLIQLIPAVLNRFRTKKIAFVSDIRKAFQMIEIAKEDQDSMRFLWCKNGDVDQLIEYKHCRVMFGATSSPFILGAVLENYLLTLPEDKRKLGEELWRSFYVDNCIASVDCQAEYRDFREMAIELLKDVKMDLRMWFSNVDADICQNPIIPVLGLLWKRETDTLALKLDKFTIPGVVTKKTILSSVAKIFDPIGFSSPALIPMKLMLQRAWIEKLGWNEELPEEEMNLFIKWMEEIQYLKEIEVPRLATAGERELDKWTMHIFADASAHAYAAVAFVRVETETDVHLNLISAKARVSPMKKLTIPRLELLSCLLAARLANAVKKSLFLDDLKEVFWSDSTTALAWIQRMEPWATWVGNRVTEIRSLTKVDQWRHVPGNQNPADLPSRGCSPLQLLNSKWWCGPNWLKLEEQEWPVMQIGVDETTVFSERKRSEIPAAVFSMSNFNLTQNFRREYSSTSQIRIMAWIGRFITNAKAEQSERRRGKLTEVEIEAAEKRIWRLIQQEYCSSEKCENLRKLEVIKDTDGILRVKTRLTLRDDLHDFKYPVLLHGKSPFVIKMIMEMHRRNHHAGVGFIMTQMREKFWILNARQTIRKVTTTCFRCRRFSSKAFTTPTPPLPLDRIKDAEVFETVGVDLAGPLFLKNGNKVWLVIFTCAVYRAVYFSVVTSLNSSAFIGALKKFVEKYRRPAVIYCDNGTNFHGAANLFRKLDWNKIQKITAINPILFKHSPPISAWYGGWWERLVGVAKNLLKRSVGTKTLNRTELEIIIREIADIMNHRPLTYISEDPKDLEPLTPAHFLNPLGKADFPEADLTTGDKLRIRWNYMRKLQAELKGRFRKEYLAYLVSRNPKKTSRGVQVGELVIVGDDNRKRLLWPLAKVVEIFPGKDGACRLAKIRTESGELIRTVQRLHPLELNFEEEKPIQELEGVVRTRAGRVVTKPSRFGVNN